MDRYACSRADAVDGVGRAARLRARSRRAARCGDRASVWCGDLLSPRRVLLGELDRSRRGRVLGEHSGTPVARLPGVGALRKRCRLPGRRSVPGRIVRRGRALQQHERHSAGDVGTDVRLRRRRVPLRARRPTSRRSTRRRLGGRVRRARRRHGSWNWALAARVRSVDGSRSSDAKLSLASMRVAAIIAALFRKGCTEDHTSPAGRCLHEDVCWK